MKSLTVEEYERLPYFHLMHDLSPLLFGCEMDVWWCNDCKIIVHYNQEKTNYIPYDKANFEFEYVKRPKIQIIRSVKP